MKGSEAGNNLCHHLGLITPLFFLSISLLLYFLVSQSWDFLRRFFFLFQKFFFYWFESYTLLLFFNGYPWKFTILRSIKPEVIQDLNFHTSTRFLGHSHWFPNAPSHLPPIHISWLTPFCSSLNPTKYFLVEAVFTYTSYMTNSFLATYSLPASQTFLLVIFLYPRIYPYSLNESLLVLRFPFEYNKGNMSLFCSCSWKMISLDVHSRLTVTFHLAPWRCFHTLLACFLYWNVSYQLVILLQVGV